jgi:cytochrome c peroxidase
MNMSAFPSSLFATLLLGVAVTTATAQAGAGNLVPGPTTEDLAWKIGKSVKKPADNAGTPAQVELGKALFFDPRLSGNGTVSCATCHNPALGWSDGLKTGIGINGQKLPRSSPTIVNAAYNTQLMWDGRARSLEDQALGPMKTPEEMSTDFKHMKLMLQSLQGYRAMFARAYPGEPIAEETAAKAIAAFERTVVSTDSRFDKWLAGDRRAITQQEWRGFQLFKAPNKGNCAVCHSGPNFTDNGFHNIGIAHSGPGEPDEGRFRQRGVASMKGAFKTPTLRDIALTGPYFHDGSATTLRDVVAHYNRGGDQPSTGKLSPEVRPLNLTESEQDDLVAFMKSLTGIQRPIALPVLPQ